MRDHYSRALLILVLLVTSCRTENADKPADKKVKIYSGHPDSTNGLISYHFDDLAGPEGTTVIPAETVTPIAHYHSDSQSRLAIYVTDTNSSWLEVAHGFSAIGIPFSVTLDLGDALQHNCVLIYPAMKTADGNATVAISQALAQGKTIIGVNVTAPSLGRSFGYAGVAASQKNLAVTFSEPITRLAELTDTAETTIPFASVRSTGLYHWSTTFSPSTATIVARYGDHSAAMLMSAAEKGKAYDIGVDIGQLIRLGYSNRQETIARSYVNRFEPAIDVWLRIIKAIYSNSSPEAVTLWPVPFGKSVSVIMTHDIDYKPSLRNAIQYAEWEKTVSVPATYFVQAKYIQDYNDRAFLDDTGSSILRSLDSMGVEIASHSVSHSHQFAKFALGNGTEAYPSYRPFVMTNDTTRNATILGELRTSKFLLEHLSGQHVASFRAGFLADPYDLPQALQATGYAYNSSVTANNSLTHLPFQLTYGRASHSEVPVFEFPITIEDREAPLMDQRIEPAIDLARKLGKYGGCVCLLIHTDIFERKLRFEQAFVPAVKDFSWFGSLRDFGDFWAARNNAQVDVTTTGQAHKVQVTVVSRVRGLTLEVPAAWKLSNSGGNVTRTANRIIIPELTGSTVISFSE